ncbi:hypothetical protein MHZ95_05795 [Sporosarcina sp. ACRSM]|uniref:hypothetical protein n=1 Tax=Sporosarcina sp. ACRSM TaxID=2918216 RepID=UPI001EF542F8|nr:hypothetical protein [Sporosarcina sp. ACRSM]MCG7334781.1 hypothetical protein [Sporosarcina sp. ACRSM]
MKKYLIFIISFIALYSLAQISSGLILTALYTPDIYSTGQLIHQEVVFTDPTYTPLLLIFLSATAAYFISQKFGETAKVQQHS